MIKFENTDVYGWESAIRGMRNPMNSWDKSDSYDDTSSVYHDDVKYITFHSFTIGSNDLELMKKLVKSGTDHSKFMRMILVTVDITAPLYWWKEFDTYKVGTVRNSCSTMHKIQEKEFTFDDFSHEHLLDDSFDIYAPMNVLENIIVALNFHREQFNRTKDKKHWYQMIQLLPSSYNQRATVLLNYAVLRNMYHSRKNHKLDEWSQGFTKWAESLPYSELITEV
jgi:hypothetical protein